MAATAIQRQIAAEVLRSGGTQEQAAKAAGVSVSTIKRWLKQPEFRAMVNASPDIRPGLPAIEAGDSQSVVPGGVRSRMWVTLGSGGSGDVEVIGSLIPAAAHQTSGAVVHVHVVPADAIDEVRRAIEAQEYPVESPYVPVPLAGLEHLVQNLPFVCRLGSVDRRESLMAWLEVWTFVDEDGRTRTLAESLWGGQQRFLETLLVEGHVVSIKSRKVGLSTVVAAHAAWTARIRDKNASVHLLSHREDAAKELLRGLRRGFEGLPTFLQLPLERQTSTVLAFAAGPGDTRSLKAFPATPNAAIEATTSHLVLDEWAHTFDPEALWAAVEPTLTARSTSALITTAVGPGDFVHDYYLRSQAGDTKHTGVFVSALERPDRSPGWVEEKRRQEGKGKTRSLHNYPLTVEEAFADASEPYFAPELLKAAQCDAILRGTVRQGDRCVKAWDIGRKRPSVCVVLRVPSEDEEPIMHLVDYAQLLGKDYPAIQREIEAMHSRYPGPTIVEANSIGKPVIQNLRLPDDELIEHMTTQASKQQMLTAIELQLQQETLKIHPKFRELLAELAEYRQPEGSITQDSVMALGFAVANAGDAHARWSGRNSVLDLEPFSDEWYDWYAARRLSSEIDLLNDNDARRGIIPPAERKARARRTGRAAPPRAN
jgi:hypothetical protein